jgi:hypothetical protein
LPHLITQARNPNAHLRILNNSTPSRTPLVPEMLRPSPIGESTERFQKRKVVFSLFILKKILKNEKVKLPSNLSSDACKKELEKLKKSWRYTPLSL